MATSIIQFQNFITATRDSGYRNTASALSELVDNAIEAGAMKISIDVNKTDKNSSEQYEVTITDDGKGMNEEELSLALQFGGSSRFNSRSGLGRYGMGLPNSSLSQCKRVEVFTWKSLRDGLYNHLDIEEVVEKNLTKLPKPKKLPHTSPTQSSSGTVVRWKKCDRLSYKYLKSLLKHIQFELGRTFRHAIWRGVEIIVCGDMVAAFDPLFIEEGLNLRGGELFGEDLTIDVKIPDCVDKSSQVRIRFVELPVDEWAGKPNEEKRKRRIIKNAGVSILRAEREIDYGWFFIGDKRKENYDDWWRCEICFHPDLDEAFGVTHTKQEIRETEYMRAILAPVLEPTARLLNNRVRQKFIDFKKSHPKVYSKPQLERTDIYMEPLNDAEHAYTQMHSDAEVSGFKYEITTEQLGKEPFFNVEEKNNAIRLTVNKDHIFYDKVFRTLHEGKIKTPKAFIKILEVLIFAAARTEFSFAGSKGQKIISEFKKEWSLNLKTFIS